MSEEKKPVADRNLVRLLRFLASGAADIAEEGGGDILLQRPQDGRAPNSTSNAQPSRHAAAALRSAISLGLVIRCGRTLRAAPPLGSYLKRAMAKDRDEVFQEQHRQVEAVVVDVGDARQTAKRNLNTSPLTSLSRLKERDGGLFFPQDALEAGERFAADFHRGHLNPRVTATWEPKIASRSRGQAGGASDLTDAAMAARTRFSRAADAMGPELSGVAIDVCCFEKGLETVERERQWPARSAKLMLRAALTTLARHYAPQPTRQNDASRHWGDDDYRPVMAAAATP